MSTVATSAGRVCCTAHDPTRAERKLDRSAVDEDDDEGAEVSTSSLFLPAMFAIARECARTSLGPTLA